MSIHFLRSRGGGEKKGKRVVGGEGVPLLTYTVIHSTGQASLIQPLAMPYLHCLETREQPDPTLAAEKKLFTSNY